MRDSATRMSWCNVWAGWKNGLPILGAREVAFDPSMKCFAICLTGLWLGVSSPAVAEIRCGELEGAKPPAQLEFLQRERAALSAECIAYATFQVGFSEYAAAIKTLVTYLDYRSPDDLRGARQMVMGRNVDPYPATSALFMIGKPAVPDLIGAISGSATSDTARNNAIWTIFTIYRANVSEAVRVLKRSARAMESTDWEGSQRLIDAASKAAGWCSIGEMSVACMAELYEKDQATKP
jgi:hypothetical protein